ncbi:trypsin-3-like [Leguminivora glycinivorella]|uniref:trypsin-3-like n=1 Tax=Leguminivora glycinivorella TaxID=1035111 RepID=UPI00200DB32C|nr:trypsin-3-like [Leguminivora glycinivorella]
MNFIFILAIFVQVSGKPSKAPGRGDLRVYKGRNDTNNEFPFAVSLQKKNPPVRFCTGSLIAENWVLTAAHCVCQEGWSPNDIVIRYGEYTKPANETTMYSNVIKIFVHPSALAIIKRHDIALILTEKIPSQNFAKLLAIDYGTFVGLPVKYAGFGLITKQVFVKDNKLIRKLTSLQIGEGIVTPCTSIYTGLLCIAPMCSNKRQQARPGDSGGPLVYDGRVIGVAKSISLDDSITRYTPVSPYLQWIQNVHGGNTISDYHNDCSFD